MTKLVDLIRGYVALVTADKRVTAREIELLRAVSASLDCPMPPIV